MLLDSTPVLYLPTRELDLAPAAFQAIKGAPTLSISMASVWEIQIKHGLKKVDIPTGLWEWFSERGVTYVPIEIEDTRLASSLPFHHRDPFDRMIIAQAKRRGMPIVTRDRAFEQYDVPVIWA